MTADGDSTGAPAPTALAVGPTRQRAAQVFGGSFDEVALGEYADLVAHPADAPGFVGIAAGPGAAAAVTAALDHASAEVTIELPRDAATARDLRRALDRPLRVVGVRRFGDAPCLVVRAAGADEGPADGDPSGSDAVVAAVLEAAVDDTGSAAADRERAGVEWELAALRERTDLMEGQLRGTRVQLARARAGSAAAAPAAGRGADAGTEPAFRALAVVTGLAGVAALLAAAAAAASGTAQGWALAAGLVLLVLLAATAAVAAVGLARRSGRRREPDGPDRLGALEELVAATLVRLETPAPDADATAAADALGDRLERVAALYAVAPPAGLVPPLGTTRATVCLLAAEDVVHRAPAAALVLSDPLPALFAALAARRTGTGLRVVLWSATDAETREARRLVDRHGVADLVEVHHVPLGASPLEDHPTPWYAADTGALPNLGLVVVAGPDEAVGPDARLPAVPLLRERLADRCTVLVAGDAGDPTDEGADGEATTERWLADLPGWTPSHEEGVLVLRSPAS